MKADIDSICRGATLCRECFTGQSSLKAPQVDIAQPRWIGQRFGQARPRIVFVLLNPAAGGASKYRYDEESRVLLRGQLRDLLLRYRDARASLTEVFQFQRTHMPVWGKTAGQFLRFYTNSLGLRLEDIAFANIAWCATKGNKYPAKMQNRCFSKFTSQLISVLSPHLTFLSGAGTTKFYARIKALCPTAIVTSMLHYAHREGNDIEEQEMDRIRKVITGWILGQKDT
jgi:uracil-DNA glycosylase